MSDSTEWATDTTHDRAECRDCDQAAARAIMIATQYGSTQGGYSTASDDCTVHTANTTRNT